MRWTPLHDAASNGNVKVVLSCLQCGDDVNARDMLGRTPLHVALSPARICTESSNPSFNATLACVSALLDASCDLSISDDAGNTVLHVAAAGSPKEVLDLLLLKGAVFSLLTQRNKLSYNPLHEAVVAGNVENVKSLVLWSRQPPHEILDYINIPSVNGFCPVHLAALTGHCAVMEVLLPMGCRMNDRVSGQLTLLHIAAIHRRRSVIRLLMTAGADMHAVNSDGNTALSVNRRAFEDYRCILDALHRWTPPLLQPDAHYDVVRACVWGVATINNLPLQFYEVIKCLMILSLTHTVNDCVVPIFPQSPWSRLDHESLSLILKFLARSWWQ